MLCKDVMFFDENMKPLEKPNFEKCSNDEFNEMYFDCYYIFIDGRKALDEWNQVYSKFVNDHESPFTLTGAYRVNCTGHVNEEYWVHLMTKISELTVEKNRLQAAYIHHSRLPLQGGEEL